MEKSTRKEILIERAIQTYIEDFDRNNRRDGISSRDESLKWSAAANFAANWDIDAPDMLSMWKKCTRQAFIDTRHSHPSHGITLLLNNTSEVEGVRKTFGNLFQKEPVDEDTKLDHILSFIDYINERLKELYPNSTINLQTKEAVITYLNLWDPDHNYRYKPAPANSWASYIGYTDWTSGQDFSLRKYYRMCDEIHEIVKSHEELLRIHRQRFENGEPDVDKELHILTFDILYCFWGYDDVRREILEEYEEAMRQQKIDDLEEKLAGIEKEIAEKASLIRQPEIAGLQVHHKKFGTGQIEQLEGTRITVNFEKEGLKLFQYPSAFQRGFLQLKDASVIHQMRMNEEIEQELDSLQKQAESFRADISSVTE